MIMVFTSGSSGEHSLISSSKIARSGFRGACARLSTNGLSFSR
jgi:hypothetical protein